jgi:glycosyltransferase involved in cell wall biosynthesis
MRVALVLYGDLDFISGGFLYDRMLVDYLRRQGEEVEIISLPWRSYPYGLLDNLSPTLRRLLTNIRADIVLQDELAHPSLFWLNRGLQGRGRPPIVAIVHHLRCSEARPAWQNCLYRLVERRYLASVTGFIFNSRATRETVEELVGRGRLSVLALPAANRFAVGLTQKDLATRAQEPGPLRLLFLGNVIPRKGLHTLLEALARLPREGWRLTVVGSLEMDAAYAQQIKRPIEDAGLGDRVEFAGVLDNEKLASILAQSQVLAVPSSYEGYGIVYLEGMAFGLPAVATTAGGAREIITSGWDGFLIAPGDAETLADHVRTLIDDRELLLDMSLAAQARFAAHPTWEDAGAAIHRFLQSLVSDDSRGGPGDRRPPALP